ncbi:uncharacterized protein K460DRAFT_416211 [Cucurbitaria berberidis CBS 394.84]|uniref:Uncharacterized protein n=1 Tax=Cucurbitaria berberidis CBS 394.84 TaxID=1168544 RepID=A0A9P4GF14_9PLEO|nr:uncharacterized protein K460DRAFT_416211 [Cucurbitaria berberidis CBS 394.84]KAF1844843.1 hypothetical protein K460DRAFT_416211 [Cucurbitaria berberidis CBS 394.84]
MSAHYPYTITFREDIDALPLTQHHFPFRDLPDGRFVAPEMKLRMHQYSESAAIALANLRRKFEPLRNPNALPRDLWDKPSLIDFDHWANVNETLRRQGVTLPWDYMSGARAPIETLANSDETLRTKDASKSHQGSARICVDERESSLAPAEQDVDVVQRRASIMHDVVAFCGTAWALIGRRSAQE